MSRLQSVSQRLFRPLKELNRDLKIIFISNILTTLGLGLYSAVWPVYIKQLGGSPVDIAAVVSLAALVATLVYLPGGYLADKYERKAIFIIASFIATPAFFIYAWARTWTDLLPGVILFNLLLIGIPAFTAYIAASVSELHSMSAFGVIGAGASVGFIISPALGGWLLGITDFRNLFYIAAILWIASTVILFPLTPQRATPRPKHEEKEWLGLRVILHDGRILYWIILLPFIYSIVQMAAPFIPGFLADTRQFNLVANQYAGSTRFLGATILGVGLGRLGDKWRREGAVAICLLIFAGGALIMIMGAALAAIAVSMLLLGSVAVFRSLGDSIIGRVAPKPSSAQIYSIYYTLGGIGQFLTPYLGGFLYTASPQLPFIGVIIIAVVVAVVILMSQASGAGLRDQELARSTVTRQM